MASPTPNGGPNHAEERPKGGDECKGGLGDSGGAKVPDSGKPVRVLCITLGGERQTLIQNMFDEIEGFEVTSRSVRSRSGLEIEAVAIGLVDEEIGVELPVVIRERSAAARSVLGDEAPASMVSRDCLWQLGRKLGRDRATLSCLFAHVGAVIRAVTEGWDVIIEDSARVFNGAAPLSSASLIRTGAAQSPGADLRLYGYSGSVDQLDALYTNHVPMHGGPQHGSVSDRPDTIQCVVPLPVVPLVSDPGPPGYGISPSGAAGGDSGSGIPGNIDTVDDAGSGACAVANGEAALAEESTAAPKRVTASYDVFFGMFGYIVSCRGAKRLLLSLRADVGSILWRPKRSKTARVKPVDRVIPRRLLYLPPGGVRGVPADAPVLSAVILSRPALFRAPMLRSTMHAKWDAPACCATAAQLGAAGVGFGTLWLSDAEKDTVGRFAATGLWDHPDGADVKAAAADTAIEAAAAALQEAHAVLKDGELTIIIVTSPIRCHPSTEMIERVVDSFRFAQSVVGCRIILVADGTKAPTDDGLYAPKRGKVPADIHKGYRGYITALHALARSDQPFWINAEVVALPNWSGFGHAVFEGLRRTKTEYVMVVQHDHCFSAAAPVTDVVKWMTKSGANYVAFPQSSCFRHVHRCSSQYQIDVSVETERLDCRTSVHPAMAATVHSGSSLGNGRDGISDRTGLGSVDNASGRLVPILFWYDSTHLARTSAYVKLVFNGDDPLPRGHFIEDTFGQRMLQCLREDYKKWFPVFRTYLFCAGPDHAEVALLYHLDGRRYHTDLERLEKQWSRNMHAE